MRLRIAPGLPSLRRGGTVRWIEWALGASNLKGVVRVTHYSIQRNHMHLIVEVEGSDQLARGVQGLTIRIVRALNRWWNRKGKVFGDRFHSRLLRTPREVWNALRYVLSNARHHGVLDNTQDPALSGEAFNGWDVWTPTTASEMRLGKRFGLLGSRVVAPRTWLLHTGWKRYGPIPRTPSPA